MIGTILALLMAVFVFYGPFSMEQMAHSEFIGISILILGALFFLIPTLAFSAAWAPLRRSEESATPRLMEMFHEDGHIRLAHAWLIVFPLLSTLIALDWMAFGILGKKILIVIWVIAFGITLDALHYSMKRIMGYLNPFSVVDMLKNRALIAIRNEKEADLCRWIDGLTEVATKATEQSSLSLCSHALTQIEDVVEVFLLSSRSIGHHEPDGDAQALGITDTVSYTLFYLFQRLELINERGIDMRLEPVCTLVVTLMGKIALHAAEYDLTLASYPLHYLGRFTETCQEHGLDDVAVKSTCIVEEVAKSLVEDFDLTYFDIKDTFFTLINILEETSKRSFKKDKTQSIALLTQPLREMKGLFENEKISGHQDARVVRESIDRAIGLFDALEVAMRKAPPMNLAEGEASATQ